MSSSLLRVENCNLTGLQGFDILPPYSITLFIKECLGKIQELYQFPVSHMHPLCSFPGKQLLVDQMDHLTELTRNSGCLLLFFLLPLSLLFLFLLLLLFPLLPSFSSPPPPAPPLPPPPSSAELTDSMTYFGTIEHK